MGEPSHAHAHTHTHAHTHARTRTRSSIQGVELNGPKNLEQRYVGNLNLSFAYVEGESLIMGLKVCAYF